ncbi:MAG TPA: hypothetical protein VE623_17330, partial [Acidimicrobiales bacterium]|nr:hypothetical protein [Acidimicrobiales bacterium]
MECEPVPVERPQPYRRTWRVVVGVVARHRRGCCEHGRRQGAVSEVHPCRFDELGHPSFGLGVHRRHRHVVVDDDHSRAAGAGRRWRHAAEQQRPPQPFGDVRRQTPNEPDLVIIET